MTKANENARASVRDAEKRAKRKLARLANKGINVSPITPLRPVDAGDTRALKKYARELEGFVSRQTRFVVGKGGAPIPYAAFRDYKRLERQWNKAHDRFWHGFAEQPFITAYGESDMTAAERSRAGHVKGAAFGGADYRRSLLPGEVGSVADLKRREKIMKRELSPSYHIERARELRRNLSMYADTFNEPAISQAIKRLSIEQLFALQNLTNFVPIFYRYINTDRDNDMGAGTDATEREAQEQHLLLTIKQVVTKYPKKFRKPKGSGGKNRRTKKSKSRKKSNVKSKSKTKAKSKA